MHCPGSLRCLEHQRYRNGANASGLAATKANLGPLFSPIKQRHAAAPASRLYRRHRAMPPELAVVGGLDDQLYGIISQMDAAVSDQLTGVTPLTFLIILAAGLASSLSPCTLSVLPLTLGYIAGYGGDGRRHSGSVSEVVLQASAFSLGLATTLAALGVASSALGKAYGQLGDGLPVAVSIIAILMGLNLLEVVQLRLLSFDLDVRAAPVPPSVQAYLAGLTFALAASPCSTPILATILAYVAQEQDLLLGGVLLLAYTIGYVAPLLLAATFAGALQRLLAMRQYSSWVTSASGTLMVAGGTYTLLSRVLPQ